MSVQNTQYGETKVNNTAQNKATNSWVWIMLLSNVVFLLVLVTIGILALKVGNALPDGVDVLYIVGRNPDTETSDEEGKVWESDTQVNIFSTEYVNGEGKTTVVSQDGTKVIAPGTLSTYRFGTYNNGNMAMVYEIDVDFVLRIAGQKQEQYEFPLSVRLKTSNGVYVIGSESEWVNVTDATQAQHVSVLGANSYEEYELELLWAFEGGNDELDTMYGNMASQNGVELSFKINTYAEEHIDASAQGGTKINPDADNSKEEYGGDMRWVWFILLLTNTGILIFFVSFLMSKHIKKVK